VRLVFYRRSIEGRALPMRAMRLSPQDLYLPNMQAAAAFAHFLDGRYDEASSCAEKALLARSGMIPALRVAAASHALGGRLGRAKTVMEILRKAYPDLRVSSIKILMPFRRPEDLARYEEGLRKAGLPE
jgi:hypothetical protein